MPRLVVRAKAELEIAAAIDWYQKPNATKAREFVAEIDRTLIAIRENPYQYQAIEGEIRRVVMQSFPYWIIYLASTSDVVVVLCFHTSRDPAAWRKRIR